MKQVLTRALVVISIFSLFFTQTGCTKAKAEAVKAAAEQFRVEADKALEFVDRKVKTDPIWKSVWDTEVNL
ncbi:MAG: hypothetical protein ABI646_06525 [Acidobacteriota bacterium]